MKKWCKSAIWKTTCQYTVGTSLQFLRIMITKRLQDEVPHLGAIHCCAHRVELAIKSVSEQLNLITSKPWKIPCIAFTCCTIGHLNAEVSSNRLENVVRCECSCACQFQGTTWIPIGRELLKFCLMAGNALCFHVSQVAMGTAAVKGRAQT